MREIHCLLQIILNSSWFVVLAEENHSNLQPEPALTGFLTGWMEFFGWTGDPSGSFLTARIYFQPTREAGSQLCFHNRWDFSSISFSICMSLIV